MFMWISPLQDAHTRAHTHIKGGWVSGWRSACCFYSKTVKALGLCVAGTKEGGRTEYLLTEQFIKNGQELSCWILGSQRSGY
jgi:hypothetical protein